MFYFYTNLNFSKTFKKIQNACVDFAGIIFPEPTARSVPGVSPGRGLLIPLGYSHPGKCEHMEVQSHPSLCNGGRN